MSLSSTVEITSQLYSSCTVTELGLLSVTHGSWIPFKLWQTSERTVANLVEVWPLRLSSSSWLSENKFSSFPSPMGAQQHSITSSVTLDHGTSSKLCSASASPRRICPITSVSHCRPRWHLSSFHISQVSVGHKGDYSAGRLCIHFHH